METLRDRPEISPCCSSGKLDCTTFTDGVSMTPRPRPISSSPGANATTRDEAPTSASSRPIPASGDDEAGDDQGSLRAPLGEPLGGERGDQDARGRRGEDHSGLDRVVAADLLEEDGDDERDPHQQQPLDVLGDQAEVGRAVPEQPEREQRLPARRARARGCRGRTRPGSAAPTARNTAISDEFVVGLQDAEHDEEHADRRQDRSDHVERARRVGRAAGSTMRRLRRTISRDRPPPGTRTPPAS